MSKVLFATEDMNVIKEQVQVLWARDMEDAELVAIRFDQSEYAEEWHDGPDLAFIYIEDGEYVVAWGNASYGDDGHLQFTETDWESWSESGMEPWRGTKEEYESLISEVYPGYPEWVHLYI